MQDKIKCTVYRLNKNKDITQNILDENNKTLTVNDPDDLDECIFMNSFMFSKIFGRTWKNILPEERLLPIVKISYNNDCIYRRYRQCSAKGLKNNKVGLTQRSISL